jgi:hypothetical protein
MPERVRRVVGFAALSLAALSEPAIALTVTPQDCREGAEFIGNAARSRDNGMSAARFIARLDEDLVMIQSVPKELRWFARDADDARFLRGAVLRVFDEPALPQLHGATFFDECMALALRAER